MFQLARQHGRGDLLCIINSDMILMPDFVESARLVKGQRSQFVMLSQRWDLDVSQPFDFTADWESRLRNTVHAAASLHRPAGSDFFLFPKSCYADIPDFIIGRAGWDNWMIYKARHEGWPVIDCTPSVTIVHQNHDYSHLPGGQANVRYTILDSTHQLADGKLARPKMTSLRFQRQLELFLRKIFFFLPENAVESLVRPKRWKKRFKKLLK